MGERASVFYNDLMPSRLPHTMLGLTVKSVGHENLDSMEKTENSMDGKVWDSGETIGQGSCNVLLVPIFMCSCMTMHQCTSTHTQKKIKID